MDSEELLRTGFLTELVERDELQPRIDLYRDNIARCDAQAVRSMKRHINAISAGEWDEASGRAAYEASMSSEETVRRLAKVAELAARTPPLTQPGTCRRRVAHDVAGPKQKLHPLNPFGGPACQNFHQGRGLAGGSACNCCRRLVRTRRRSSTSRA